MNKCWKKLMVLGCAMTVFAAGTAYAEEDQADLLKKIGDANTREALLEAHERVAYNAVYYYPDLTPDEIYTYEDQEKYAYITSYMDVVIKDGSSYAFYSEEGLIEKDVYVGEGAGEEYYNSMPLAWFAYDENEILLSVEEKEGILCVETTAPIGVDRDIVDYGYDESVMTDFQYRYEVDAETYELLSMAYDMVSETGEIYPFFEMTRDEACEEYVEAEEALEKLADTDVRTVTLIENAGTEEEKVYTGSIAKGGVFYIYFADGYEEVLYADAECTEQFTSNEEDRESDVVAYVRKAE